MESPYNRRCLNTFRNRFNFRDYSLLKTLLLTTVITILVLTNPANDFHVTPALLRSSFNTCTSRTMKRKEKKRGRTRDGSDFYSWNIVGKSIDKPDFCSIKEFYSSINSYVKKTSTRNMETNYGIFSMWIERDTAVHLAFLLQDFTICKFQSNAYGIQSKCNWVATNLCHGMKAFDGQSAFTALRIIQILKILSYLLSTCYRYSSNLFYTIRQRNPFAPCLSLFRQDYWCKDLISINLFIYPALVLLERISSIGTSRNTTAKLHFWAGTFVLVVVFGGLTNLMAPILTRQRQDNICCSRHGMKGSVAACLGYIVATAPHKIVLDLDWLFEVGLTAGDILFGSLGLAFLSHMTGLHRYSFGCLKEWSAGDTSVWILGGLCGSFFGKWHLEHLEEYGEWWWRNPFGIYLLKTRNIL